MGSTTPKKSRYIVVDEKSGEVVDYLSTVPSKRRAKERYVKMFYPNPMLGSVLPHASRTLLFALASKMPYSDTGAVLHVSPSVKKQIAQEFGISIASIDKGLPYLIKNGYLYRLTRGEYMVNPYLFGKGPAAAIQARREEWDTLIAGGNKNVSAGQETASEEENTPA